MLQEFLLMALAHTEKEQQSPGLEMETAAVQGAVS